MDFRQYNPAIGRFTSIDPVTHFNQSTYTAFDNNPIFYSDPSGADSKSSSSVEDFFRKLFDNSKSGDKWVNNNGTFTNQRTGQKEECDDCSKQAKGGHFNGRYFSSLMGVHSNKGSGSFFNRYNLIGKKLTEEELANHIEKYVEHLEELKDLINQASNTGLGVSALAYLLKKRTPVGLLLSGLGKIAAMDIPEHEKELLRVTLRYMKLHSKAPSQRRGVYIIKEKSGSLLVPGSDVYKVNYYDAKTGKYLGGLSKGIFSSKQEKYVD